MTKRYAPVEGYIHLLKREIRIIRQLLKDSHRVTHIHFGGGSPTMLQPEDFTMLMQEIRKEFVVDKQAEIAIEIDPRGITEAKVAAYAKAGVNRASLGVQDYHKEVQEAINRLQPFHVVYEAVNFLHLYGISRINMDLMYGLPHQTATDIEENVSYALLSEPDRIALFGYA